MPFSFAKSILTQKLRLQKLEATYREEPSKVNKISFKNQEKRRRLYLSQRGRCCFCKAMTFLDGNGQENPPAKAFLATIEHIKPKSKGGSNKITNLAISCYSCNNQRGTIEFNHFKTLVETGKFHTLLLSKKRRIMIRQKKRVAEKLERYENDPVYRAKVDAYALKFPQMKNRMDEIRKKVS